MCPVEGLAGGREGSMKHTARVSLVQNQTQFLVVLCLLLTLRCNNWPRCMIKESGAEEILSLEGDKEEEMQEGGE